jgi:FixJ family two-component response regulator
MKNDERSIVLVVDDDHAVRHSLEFSLELEGLDVRACSSGAELLSHPDLEMADCILLDYKMPVMDGLEVLKHLSARAIFIPVILITSQATLSLSNRAKAAGVSHIVEKPLLDGALLHTIQSVLES